MLLNHQDTEITYAQSENEPSQQTRTTSHKTRGRKPIEKVSKIQQVLNNLPSGVTYIGPEGGLTEENVIAYAKNMAIHDGSNQMEDSCIFERTMTNDDIYEPSVMYGVK